MTNTGSDTKESLNKYFLNECYSEIHESGALLTKEFWLLPTQSWRLYINL